VSDRLYKQLLRVARTGRAYVSATVDEGDCESGPIAYRFNEVRLGGVVLSRREGRTGEIYVHLLGADRGWEGYRWDIDLTIDGRDKLQKAILIAFRDRFTAPPEHRPDYYRGRHSINDVREMARTYGRHWRGALLACESQEDNYRG
jgi:hypothetical protein